MGFLLDLTLIDPKNLNPYLYIAKDDLEYLYSLNLFIILNWRGLETNDQAGLSLRRSGRVSTSLGSTSFIFDIMP